MVVDRITNRRSSCLWSKTARGPETAPVTPCRQRFRSPAVVVVAELPQTPEDDAQKR